MSLFVYYNCKFYINLYIHSTAKDESLATLALHYFSTNGTQLSDGSMSVSVVLCDIILDDKRPNRQQKLTRQSSQNENIISAVNIIFCTSIVDS